MVHRLHCWQGTRFRQSRWYIITSVAGRAHAGVAIDVIHLCTSAGRAGAAVSSTGDHSAVADKARLGASRGITAQRKEGRRG